MKKKNGMVWIKSATMGFLIISLTFALFSCSKNTGNGSQNGTSPAATEPSKPPAVSEPGVTQNPSQPPSSVLDKYLIPVNQRVQAADFRLPTLDGKSLQLSTLKGTVVLLDFSTTWCTWCTTQEPHLDKLYEDYHDQSFEIISIFCRENKQTVLYKYPTGKHTYPILLDENGNVSSNEYGVQGYPYYLLVDKQGRIAYYQRGYDENMYTIVSQLIESLNAEN